MIGTVSVLFLRRLGSIILHDFFGSGKYQDIPLIGPHATVTMEEKATKKATCRVRDPVHRSTLSRLASGLVAA